jgi:hypothetical protein
MFKTLIVAKIENYKFGFDHYFFGTTVRALDRSNGTLHPSNRCNI